MAAKPPKPPDSSGLYSNCNSLSSLSDQDDSDRCQQRKKSDCSCTNISIMQLFHEMKQEFPTVPDYIVNQYVTDNCHDRETCIECLKKVLAAQPNTVQAYPSQVLRNNHGLMCKKVLTPTRKAPEPTGLVKKVNCPLNINKTEELTNINNNNINNNNNNIISDIEKNCISETNCQSSDYHNHSHTHNHTGNDPNTPPQRPTTLHFRKATPNPSLGDIGNTVNQRPVCRPVRTAPPPPVLSQKSAQPTSIVLPTPTTTLSNAVTPSTKPQSSQIPLATPIQNISSTVIQSPGSFSDSGKSEISVNISLSPNSDISRGPPTRHVSSLTVQPAPAYSGHITPQSPRSYTSVNLVLRNPSTNPQSPIDITAGPSLTYSSSSFDARRGYQKEFCITVSGNGGCFSASHTKPPNSYNMTVGHSDVDFNTPTRNNTHPFSSLSSNATENVPARKHSAAENFQLEGEVLSQQRAAKERLSVEVEKDRKRLKKIEHQIKVLESSVTPDNVAVLDSEIEKLCCDCLKIIEDIEREKELAAQRLRTQQQQQQQRRQQLGNWQSQRLQESMAAPQTFSRISSQHQNPARLHPSHREPFSQIPLMPQNMEGEAGATARIVRNATTAEATATPTTAAAASASTQRNANTDESEYSVASDDEDGPHWICSSCTFQNHPLLNKCEECGMRRIPPGTIEIISTKYEPIASC